MKDSEHSQPALSESTGTFHYQELIESRLGQPIASDLLEAEAQRLAASPGAKLAAARLALGWSVEKVASQLRLAPRQIIALEKDDYPALPEAAIVKGFTRAYAKLVKLDPEPVLALIAADTDQKRLAPGKLEKPRRPGNPAQNQGSALGIYICLFIVAALAYAYFNLH
ncbi:helix-turn-helix domain-containing protein [Undibacterium sp. TC4M20W]|uniref:helix-turn-helix domain-containing protein n=1 Tax=unclassified Undibacterium TaxID=2630295 RepID=UPI003BF3F162